MTVDLSLLETEALFTELGSRFDDFVLAGVQHRTAENDAVTVFYRGGFTACIGLSELIANDMSIAMQELRETVDE